MTFSSAPPIVEHRHRGERLAHRRRADAGKPGIHHRRSPVRSDRRRVGFQDSGGQTRNRSAARNERSSIAAARTRRRSRRSRRVHGRFLHFCSCLGRSLALRVRRSRRRCRDRPRSSEHGSTSTRLGRLFLRVRSLPAGGRSVSKPEPLGGQQLRNSTCAGGSARSWGTPRRRSRHFGPFAPVCAGRGGPSRPTFRRERGYARSLSFRVRVRRATGRDTRRALAATRFRRRTLDSGGSGGADHGGRR